MLKTNYCPINQIKGHMVVPWQVEGKMHMVELIS